MIVAMDHEEDFPLQRGGMSNTSLFVSLADLLSICVLPFRWAAKSIENRTTAASVRLMRDPEPILTWRSRSRAILHCAVLNVLDFLNALLVPATTEPRLKPDLDDPFGQFGTEHTAAKR